VVFENCLDVLRLLENLLLLPAFELASSSSAMGKEMCYTITVQPTCVFINKKRIKKPG
jgi:hypothetical protein